MQGLFLFLIAILERIALRDNQWQNTQLGILSEGFSGEVGK